MIHVRHRAKLEILHNFAEDCSLSSAQTSKESCVLGFQRHREKKTISRRCAAARQEPMHTIGRLLLTSTVRPRRWASGRAWRLSSRIHGMSEVQISALFGRSQANHRARAGMLHGPACALCARAHRARRARARSRRRHKRGGPSNERLFGRRSAILSALGPPRPSWQSCAYYLKRWRIPPRRGRRDLKS